MKISYPARFEAGPQGRVMVSFRDLPEAATDGADFDEALEEALDLLNSALCFRIKYREAIPTPSKPRKGEVAIVPDTGVALKTALYVAVSDNDMSAAELARRLGVDQKVAQRLLNPHHSSTIDRMNAAIRAAGKQAVIEVRPTA